MFLGRLSVRVRNRIANEKVCKALGVDQIIKKPIKVVLENSAATTGGSAQDHHRA
jgi:hypothetical protein